MPASRQLAPLPTQASPAPGAPGRRLSPLARDIIVVLIVKAAILCVLWYAFFRTPAAPGMTMDTVVVEQRLISPAANAEPAHECGGRSQGRNVASPRDCARPTLDASRARYHE